MLTLLNGFDRNFNRALMEHSRLFDSPQPRGLRMAWPPVEIAETANHVEVRADVPGFTAEDLNITWHDSVLTIVGNTSEKDTVAEGEERTVLFSERRELSFTRTFRLDQELDGEAIAASVKDGVLTVTLPKLEAAKPKQVAITSK